MTHRSPRGPGFFYAAITLGIILILMATALTGRQPPPPTIAEFAPQALEQIKDAPSEQSSDFGTAAGGIGGAPGSPPGQPETFPEPPPIDVPRVRRCIGDPPRQIEDPQSPPCIPYWVGNNGGVTAKGVTANEVRIYLATSDGASSDIYSQLQTFFNKRFEFYGRKLNFIPGRADIGLPAAANQQADAVTADGQNVFASTFYRNSDGLHYRAELARRKVISVGIYQPSQHSYLAQYRPYMWQYPMEAERIFANMGEWTCKRLAGDTAVHSGRDSLRTQTRAFAVVIQPYYEEETHETTALESELSKCAVKPTVILRDPVRASAVGGASSAANDPVSSRNAMINIKEADSTSVLCFCNLFAFGALQSASSSENYYPEWLVSSYGALDINNSFRVGASPPEQLENTFGLGFIPRQARVENEPYWWAVKEGDPGTVNSNNTVQAVARNNQYRTILLLASGIQMAGPNLTASRFEQALHSVRFPNPPHPIMSGKVGFQGGAYSMTIDGTEMWWSNTAASPYGDEGTLCYVNGGRRYSAGGWPSERPDPFFQGTCDAG